MSPGVVANRGAWRGSLWVPDELKAGLIEQLGSGNIQCSGDTQDVRQRDIALAPFDRADIGAMNTDLGRKGFLRNAARLRARITEPSFFCASSMRVVIFQIVLIDDYKSTHYK